MSPSLLSALLSTIILLSAAASGDTSSDNIILNCGSSGRSIDSDNRTWIGDVRSEYSPTLSPGPAALVQNSSVPRVPYLTARIFTSPFTYSFPLRPGRKFLRLHFYPTNYSNYDPSDAVFGVTAGFTTLLNNFNAYQTAQALNFSYLVREYSLNVSTLVLDVSFVPSTSHTNSYAFVNGIEVVSIPDIFDLDPPKLVPSQYPYVLEPDWAVETVYRLNVGGQAVSPTEDSGLLRSWYDDSQYIYGAASGVTYSANANVTIQYPRSVPTYIAPVNVYSTARSMGPDEHINLSNNLTWILTVDGGFYYLLRLHFCEIVYPITAMNQRVFDIYINNMTAEEQVDVIERSGGLGHPWFSDYVVAMTGSRLTYLWLALHPDLSMKPMYYDAILNGLEIFKLQDNNYNLAGSNPELEGQQEIDPNKALDRHTRTKSKSEVPAIAGGVGGGIVALLGCLVLFMVCWQRQKKNTRSASEPVTDGQSVWVPQPLDSNSDFTGSSQANTFVSYSPSLPSDLCRHFSFAEIEMATNGFDEALLLGVGGFGKVYRGHIDGGSVEVATKRGNLLSGQGLHEFQTEIEMLSKLRHRHLVSLIGYCNEDGEMILVYDYMAHGALREHLYKTQKPPLPWKQRLEICIGAARGLHYLHTGAKYPIIHRDVKTTNILLDDKFVAKVSDFGLSKIGPTPESTHVTTAVKGSFGYLDPEYFRRHQLTKKSDVYSFGVVLFEVLCARPALNPTLPTEQVSLAEWALQSQKKGVLDQIVDPYLRGKISPQCFRKYAETAEKCVSDKGIDRPEMGDVLWSLEFALQLQDDAEDPSTESNTTALQLQEDAEDPSTESNTTTITESSMSIGRRNLTDSDGLMAFSQIVNPSGQ